MIADSVRLALPAEAGQIAALQRRAWSSGPDELASALLDEVDLAAMTAAWERAILRPPLAQFRVLVAVGGTGRVVGFAAIGPSDDPDATGGEDALIAEFVVDPAARGQGHGSRLLNACVDTFRADGFVRATWWVRSTDDDLRAFVTGSGWAPDGGHREVGTADEHARVKLIRLRTDISTP